MHEKHQLLSLAMEELSERLAGQLTSGKQGVPTMILEVVASKNLEIWYAFFGTVRS
jgi:hypothetical protein